MLESDIEYTKKYQAKAKEVAKDLYKIANNNIMHLLIGTPATVTTGKLKGRIGYIKAFHFATDIEPECLVLLEFPKRQGYGKGFLNCSDARTYYPFDEVVLMKE